MNSNIYLMSELEEERYNELAFISATNHAKEEGKENTLKELIKNNNYIYEKKYHTLIFNNH